MCPLLSPLGLCPVALLGSFQVFSVLLTCRSYFRKHVDDISEISFRFECEEKKKKEMILF